MFGRGLLMRAKIAAAAAHRPGTIDRLRHRADSSGIAGESGSRATRAAEVRAALADAILSGALAPGSRLDEADLARRFAVSRTPIREALRELTAIGLAEAGQGRSLFAASLTEGRLAELFEVMAETEALCAQLAARKMTAAQRHDLELLHRTSAVVVRSGGHEAYAGVNEGFHNAIYDGSHNGFLVETTLNVRRRLAPFRRAQFRTLGRLAKSYQEHDRIVEAILRADAEAAARAMRDHIWTVRDAFTAYTAGLSRSIGTAPLELVDLP
jgi:DNA-binding GntR family transcriptional regulator